MPQTVLVHEFQHECKCFCISVNIQTIIIGHTNQLRKKKSEITKKKRKKKSVRCKKHQQSKDQTGITVYFLFSSFTFRLFRKNTEKKNPNEKWTRWNEETERHQIFLFKEKNHATQIEIWVFNNSRYSSFGLVHVCASNDLEKNKIETRWKKEFGINR